MAGKIQIQLFGNLSVSIGGRPVVGLNTSRIQSLLGYLILHANTPQPREMLAFTLWPASKESQARTNLRQLLHNLRRALGDHPSLVIEHLTVEWRADDSNSVDALEFLRAIESRSLAVAAELYEDDLLPAVYDDWITPVREEFRRRIVNVLRGLVAIHEETGDYAGAISRAERLAALDSLSEANYQMLMRLHAANRDRASALRAYHQCMRILRREMGVEPGPATREIFERILKADSVPPVPPATKQRAVQQKNRVFVGRAEEWAQLGELWQAVIETGPRTAVISGEPGIGKTRLADELYHFCVRSGSATARARCYTGQGQVSYAPVAEWLRSESIHAGVRHLRPDQLSEIARVVPELQEPSPDSERLPQSWQRLYFYESLNAAFGKCRKPLLLMLDDLQWCDPETIEWLGTLLHSPHASGVLVLATLREGETGREHPAGRFLGGLRQSSSLTEIPLRPLSAVETAELVRAESASPSAAQTAEDIYRATRGNPLFVVESLRAGLHSTRVGAVIASRLEQLSPGAHELAGLASVVGRPFSFELLEKATDWDESSVSSALDELWRSRIVESHGPAEYDFTHDRVREVAFGELSLVRRRYLHRRLARALAEVHRSDIEIWNGQIAAQLENAGMPEEALGHYAQAADYARRRFADTEAAELARRALAICRSLPESGRRQRRELDLLVVLGAALVTTEGYSSPVVGETYEAALQLSRRLEDHQIDMILSGSWVFHIVRGSLIKAREVSEEFLRRARADGAAIRLQAGNFLMGSCLFHLGDMAGALEYMPEAQRYETRGAESALALFAGPDLGVFCRAYMAHLAWNNDQADGGQGYAEEAIALARAIPHPFSEAIALAYAALLEAFRGDAAAALERGREAVTLCSSHGFVYYLAMANIVTGWAEAAAGNQERGLSQLRAGLAGMERLQAEIRMPYYLAMLAETLGRSGATGDALASISTGFAFAGRNHEKWALAELHRVEGNLLLASGQPDEARRCFEQGMEAARKFGLPAFIRKISRSAGGTAKAMSTERF
ncbi:MAG TPA: AAA family ATPase [Bryobacteraceae bacterium]|nr:AAA family ATPase [Bryobacteraceae bacterium]